MKLKEYYNKQALEVDVLEVTYDNPSLYKRFFYLSRFNKVFGMLDPRKGEKILDVGCGVGYYAKHIADKGALLTCQDISENYINQAKRFVGKRKMVEFLTCDASKLPFSNNTFDKVLATEVIEHIPNYEKAVGEIARVLRPSGSAVISTPFKYSPLNLAYALKRKIKGYFNEHVHEFTPEELKKLLDRHFIIRKFEFVNYVLPYPLENLFLNTESKRVLGILEWLEKSLPNTPVLKYLGWTMVVKVEKVK